MSDGQPLVSVVITTYNRAGALRETLERLGAQTLGPDHYEVIVTDDGSTDETPALLAEISMPCRLVTIRQTTNSGISAGRNLAIENARGEYLVLVSDDLLVPPDFLERHVATLRRFPGNWVVGGLRQLPASTDSTFGRYLDGLERGFDRERRERQIAPGIWALGSPTARNLSLPREDFVRAGPFDEQFRNACEDQDLAHRARELGIGFLYDTGITCLHNDQVADLARCCRQQRAFGHDGVLFCAKRPEIHGGFEVMRANRSITRNDGIALMLKKATKAALARDQVIDNLPRAVALVEQARVPERWLFRIYRAVISLSIFRGVRDGLATLQRDGKGELADSLGSNPRS